MGAPIPFDDVEVEVYGSTVLVAIKDWPLLQFNSRDEVAEFFGVIRRKGLDAPDLLADPQLPGLTDETAGE